MYVDSQGAYLEGYSMVLKKKCRPTKSCVMLFAHENYQKVILRAFKYYKTYKIPNIFLKYSIQDKSRQNFEILALHERFLCKEIC